MVDSADTRPKAPRPKAQGPKARQALATGAIGVVLGIATSVLGFDRAGAALTLSALLTLLWGLHRFGRTGADAPGALRDTR